jgi:hypothetical protein
MTNTIKGLNCKVEVALTFDSPTSPSAVTKAYPPVVTLTSHGLAAGVVGYWTATSGMIQLHKQAFVVDNPLTNTYDMSGLDATDFDTFTAGPTTTTAATWGTIAEAAAYSVGGGAAPELDDTRLTDTKTRSESGLLQGQTLTIDVRNARMGSTAMLYVQRMAQRGLEVLVKITQAGQIVRVAYGVPSLPDESVSSGQLAAGQFSIIVPAFALKPDSVIA